MQVRRFWPPTKNKLLYANLVVYGVILVLLLVFGHELIWAQKALRGFLFSGYISASKDRLLIAEALKSVKNGKDIEHVQQLLEQASQIDPYNNAQLLLGYCYLRKGEYDKMLACYEKYRSIDPYNAEIYTDMVKILEKKGDYKAIEQLLTEGIKHFQRRVKLYQPYNDPNVPKEFNRKAVEIHNRAKQGLELLEKMRNSFTHMHQNSSFSTFSNNESR